LILLTRTIIPAEILLRAVRIHAHGGIDQLRYEDAPKPRLTSQEEAIVKLKAASLNSVDGTIRRGLAGRKPWLPHVLGVDGAGVVIETGAQVTKVKTGDAVCLYPLSGCRRCEFCLTDREFMCMESRVLGQNENGTYAEYVRVPGRNCFSIPQDFSFEEAAAIPLVYLTLWRMLVTNAELRPGEHVLILGIGGGVALAALQVAARMGAHIIVTSSSEEKLLKAKELGAAQGINYRTEDFAKAVRQLTGKRGVDVVVDCIGGESWVKSLASLAKGGRLVTCGAIDGSYPQTDIRRIFWNNLKVFGSTLGTREEFAQVLKFMETTRTKPIIDQMFPLKEAAAAHKRMEEGKQFGKIVLGVDN
jgi:NADPH:quinone reductase-like Zn-dependent oxidoreductase